MGRVEVPGEAPPLKRLDLCGRSPEPDEHVTKGELLPEQPGGKNRQAKEGADEKVLAPEFVLNLGVPQ